MNNYYMTDYEEEKELAILSKLKEVGNTMGIHKKENIDILRSVIKRTEKMHRDLRNKNRKNLSAVEAWLGKIQPDLYDNIKAKVSSAMTEAFICGRDMAHDSYPQKTMINDEKNNQLAAIIAGEIVSCIKHYVDHK